MLVVFAKMSEAAGHTKDLAPVAAAAAAAGCWPHHRIEWSCVRAALHFMDGPRTGTSVPQPLPPVLSSLLRRR